MAPFLLFTKFLLVSFTVNSLDCSLLKAVSDAHRAAGVFLLIENGAYTLNFTDARAACLSLNVTMATVTQMERAVQQGLETCKYGWIDEQIAVVPRLSVDSKCGRGNTGVVKWFAQPHKKFGVFCFNASGMPPYIPAERFGVKETLKSSTPGPQTSTASTSSMATAQTLAPTTPVVSSAATSQPLPGHPESPESIILTSPSSLPGKTATSREFSSTFPALKYFTIRTSSLPRVITSSPVATSFTSSALPHASNYSVSSEPAVQHSVSSAGLPLGAVSTALVVLAVVLLILAAAGATCYYKLNVSPFWSQRQLKDDVETEMWKHTDSEMDLHSERGAEEGEDGEEEDRKYSSDIMLCVNPDMRANPSE